MVLVGRLKIPYQDLFILSNSEIDMLVYGHEIDIKEKMELDRRFVGLMVSPYAPKSYNIAKEIPFAWDEKEEINWSKPKDYENARKTLETVNKFKNVKSQN
jgi:hypothetical protein